MSGFKKVLFYAKEHRNKMYLAFFLILFSVIAGITPYLITYDLILRFVEKHTITPGYLLLMGGGVIAGLFMQSFLFYKGLTASHQAAFDTLMGMRMKFADKMTKLPLGDIYKKGTGSYKKIFVDDIENVELMLAHMLPEGIPYILAPIIVYIVLFIVDWRLALLSLASILIGMIAVGLLMRAGLKKMDQYYTAARKMNSTIIEYISGMEVIKVFNRTTNSYEHYVESVENYKKYSLAWCNESWTYMAIYGSVLPCTILFLLPVGTVFYIQGTLTLSTFVFALLLSMSLGQPFIRLVEFFPVVPVLKHKIEQLEQTFAGEELAIADKGIDPENYNVEFHDVTFAYEQTEVIKQVSFCAPENSVTAIVGASGSGKSTLAKLLVHFWDVKEGRITIGGININEISFEKLMNLISYVSQDTFLFHASIMENIRIGRPEATDAEVIAAAKLAMCHDFIMKMEQGYGTNAGEDGNKLSGGEKQRITIARAILKNSPVIILDEATAFTDPENEDKIQEALNQLIAGKTLIVIAHRLSTIMEADNILVMDKGKLLMQGSHTELLAKCGTYQSLWDSHRQSINWGVQVKGDQNA
ncbi:ABC transporter ATP-binding protein [Sporomusa sp. KB1]|jgi:ATP-binding cassette subfamily B protein|uniref:ABC transporter ATP-binding protein n=1 Tax=Sporomusa sp. KB1 TaxID=943346 RepID=UPI00119F6724|nr:ABC transporter ATP-binding protein [Sporomusa sp. KB1]TWH46122.1 ATP-binding cassette subfamily B protein [Sporomusa sp. KB1]